MTNTNDVNMISLSIVFSYAGEDAVLARLDRANEDGHLSISHAGRSHYRVACPIEDEMEIRARFCDLPGVVVIRTSALG
jgi:hypothetical protein